MKNKDRPAMPVVTANTVRDSGMSKREYMAVQIAAGLAADNTMKTEGIAATAVEIADALLEELEWG